MICCCFINILSSLGICRERLGWLDKAPALVALFLIQSMDLICQTRKESRASDSGWIPPEIIGEILSRLPVKTLLRFRCVCKSWKSLISDACFIRKHLFHMSASTGCPSQRHLLFADKKFTRLEVVSLDSVLGSKHCESIANPPRSVLQFDEIPLGNLQPMGSCNGLILLLDRDRGTLLLSNPSTRETKILPDGVLHRRRRMNNLFSFGYDSASDDYKVAEIFGKRASLYSLQKNSWKRIADLPYRLEYSSPCCGNYFIWRIDCMMPKTWEKFMSFDLVTESFQERPLPPGTIKKYYVLGELHGNVCTLYQFSSRIDMWVMKEFGLKESWVKFLTFPPPEICLSKFLCTSGDQIVLGGSSVAIHNKKNGTNKNILFEDLQTNLPQIYVESLVSPNRE